MYKRGCKKRRQKEIVATVAIVNELTELKRMGGIAPSCLHRNMSGKALFANTSSRDECLTREVGGSGDVEGEAQGEGKGAAVKG